MHPWNFLEQTYPGTTCRANENLRCYWLFIIIQRICKRQFTLRVRQSIEGRNKGQVAVSVLVLYTNMKKIWNHLCLKGTKHRARQPCVSHLWELHVRGSRYWSGRNPKVVRTVTLTDDMCPWKWNLNNRREFSTNIESMQIVRYCGRFWAITFDTTQCTFKILWD